MLAENPHILKRLREEIHEKVGETRRPTFEDMKDMKYLRAVINETIRLYPPVYAFFLFPPAPFVVLTRLNADLSTSGPLQRLSSFLENLVPYPFTFPHIPSQSFVDTNDFLRIR
jgi:hypothetical protein